VWNKISTCGNSALVHFLHVAKKHISVLYSKSMYLHQTASELHTGVSSQRDLWSSWLFSEKYTKCCKNVFVVAKCMFY
jgi:hypothetical protein